MGGPGDGGVFLAGSCCEITKARTCGGARDLTQLRYLTRSQGDKERDAGNEVQAMYDRAKADKPNAQIGFVEFIVVPLYVEMLALVPGIDMIIANMLTNHQTYCHRAVEKLEAAEQRDEEKIEKMKSKPAALREKFEAKLGYDRVNRSGGASPPVGGRRMSASIAYGGATSVPTNAAGRTSIRAQRRPSAVSVRRASVQLTQAKQSPARRQSSANS